MNVAIFCPSCQEKLEVVVLDDEPRTWGCPVCRHLMLIDPSGSGKLADIEVLKVANIPDPEDKLEAAESTALTGKDGQPLMTYHCNESGEIDRVTVQAKIAPHHRQLLDAINEGKRLDVRAIPQPKRIDLTKVREHLRKQAEQLVGGSRHSSVPPPPKGHVYMEGLSDEKKATQYFRTEKDTYTPEQARDFDEALMEMVDMWQPEIAATFKVLLVGNGINFASVVNVRHRKDLPDCRMWPKAPEISLTPATTFTPEQGKQMEDKLIEVMEQWSLETKASVYLRLGQRGLDIVKAREIRREAKLTG